MEGLTEQKIDGVIELFLEDMKCGKDLKKWPLKFPSYSISKAALNAYTRLLARELEGKACVNSVHPGYVKTDLTHVIGDISAPQGAEHVLRVALFPADGPTGHNFLESQLSPF
jgi:(+)-neomenthol dehydrogenase